jgi:hypothetical protein
VRARAALAGPEAESAAGAQGAAAAASSASGPRADSEGAFARRGAARRGAARRAARGGDSVGSMGVNEDVSGRPPSWYYRENKDTIYELKKKAARRIRGIGKTLSRTFTDQQKREEEELNNMRYKFQDSASPASPRTSVSSGGVSRKSLGKSSA